MIKAAIITINDYSNYGNRLQNYAAQEVLKSMGLSVKTIVNDVECEKHINNNGNKLLDKLSKLKSMQAKEIYEKVWYKIYKHKLENCMKSRLKRFKEFTKDNICETNYCISQSNIPKNLANEFDYFVVGSDQIWNPIFRHGSFIDFLTFVPSYKRIAYAPSFGIDEVLSKYVENYSTWLSQMHRLSVREESGARIIKKLTGREAEVLVDPTLMLSKEKWLSISKKDENKPKGRYLLTYFLGDMSKKTKKEIKQISKMNKLPIVNLGSMKDAEIYKVGPSEFIDYINSASVLFTDSFHGCVFSILFDTPFVVLEREGNLPSMNSRIDTLLKVFKLDDRRKCNIKNVEQIFCADYKHVNIILKNEREKTINYLREALNLLE